jgi:hypothetical protein
MSQSILPFDLFQILPEFVCGYILTYFNIYDYLSIYNNIQGYISYNNELISRSNLLFSSNNRLAIKSIKCQIDSTNKSLVNTLQIFTNITTLDIHNLEDSSYLPDSLADILLNFHQLQRLIGLPKLTPKLAQCIGAFKNQLTHLTINLINLY